MIAGHDNQKPQGGSVPPTPRSGPERQSPGEIMAGWLAVFLIMAGMGVLAGIGIYLYNIAQGAYHTDSIALTFGLLAIDTLMTLSMTAAYGYMLYSFLKRRANAVVVGKLYVAFIFATWLMELGARMAFGVQQDTPFSNPARVVQGLVWSSAWFLFFCHSKQVARLFPVENRVVMSRDKIWFGAMIGLAVVALSSIATVYLNAL